MARKWNAEQKIAWGQKMKALRDKKKSAEQIKEIKSDNNVETLKCKNCGYKFNGKEAFIDFGKKCCPKCLALI